MRRSFLILFSPHSYSSFPSAASSSRVDNEEKTFALIHLSLFPLFLYNRKPENRSADKRTERLEIYRADNSSFTINKGIFQG